MGRSLPDNYWRKKSMPETDPEEVETDKGNKVEEGEMYEVLPKYLDQRQPAECVSLYWEHEKGSFVLKAVFRYTDDALERFRGKIRRIDGFDIDYVVYGDRE